ncbi:hypothetical protein M8818_003150 [Zalaria obscura]|uniref:Uncharacterized protein n=1 Tax=Zalaria obscura TaxID=2024903 RepID=A0ACC3SFT0_9PEZI
MEGLARKLRSVGVLQSVSELADFARAFALNQPLFSCIDVGAGKERADHKIKETLRLFISNTQCKHIIFGGCHDNGYLPNLDPYKRDGTIASRISLLEGYAVQPGFLALGYQMTRFPDVFRRDPLPERLMSMAPLQAVLKPEPPAAVPQTASPTPSHSSTTSGVRVDSAVRPSLSSPAESSTWAAVGKSGVTGKCINITPSKAPNRRHIITNAYKQRLDPDLPKPDYAAQQRLFDRIRKHKVCNAYHLIGKCEAGEYCDYDHGERLSPGEQLALRHRARTRSCMNRGDCRDFYCTLGHICPYGDKCTGGDQCWFADVHDIDQTPAWRLFESGEKELVKEAA